MACLNHKFLIGIDFLDIVEMNVRGDNILISWLQGQVNDNSIFDILQIDFDYEGMKNKKSDNYASRSHWKSNRKLSSELGKGHRANTSKSKATVAFKEGKGKWAGKRVDKNRYYGKRKYRPSIRGL